ncbi:hypothetical protein H5410_041171 [Solanum commersonii]|uniref:Uncharacterized protein n=1 Tax=Solanum commersonii TaxID=4109 RepID=A0A9J5XR26_SOLCO|nr:hypothetical protein H5410_041171 [Solanum commersonii]
MKNTKVALSKWSREKFGDIFNHLKIREDIVRLHYEEKYWKQKAGIPWFSEGDRNTKFFHNLVNGRRKRLLINRIGKNNGKWVVGQEEVQLKLSNFIIISSILILIMRS